MREKVRIIVLNTTDFGDKSLVVHCISDRWGRRSFMASRSSKASSGIYSPMNIVDCEVTPSTKSDLWRMQNPALHMPLASIRGSICKTAISLFMSEVLYRTVREPVQDDGEFFSWCEKAVMTLDNLGSDFANYHIVFLLGLAAALGFRPDTDSIAPFAGRQLTRLRQFLTLDIPEAMLVSLSGSERTDICRCIIKYLEAHTEYRLDINSLDVLHELFA